MLNKNNYNAYSSNQDSNKEKFSNFKSVNEKSSNFKSVKDKSSNFKSVKDKSCTPKQPIDFDNKSLEKIIYKSDSLEIDEYFHILKTFKHTLIENLHDSFGYNKSILKMCSYLMHKKSLFISTEEMNKCFWELMKYRLDENNQKIFQDWITNIDSIEQNMLDKTKEMRANCMTCFMCHKNEVSILYLPCGHVIVCSVCHEKNVQECLSCQTPIIESHVIYM